MSRYVKNVTYTLDLLGGGSTTTNIPSLHVVMWIILTTMNWQKMVFEQQQLTHGRMQMHNGQFIMNIVNSLSVLMMGLSMCEPICICECGIILFPCDVKWVGSRKKPLPIKPPNLRTYPMA